ncbi:MAG: flagellar export protein FliJ [Burkholderiales bacterium]|nr:flagellar export protein FliJ [Burkholderiales bacterium]MDE2433249.1 flagellar export protein FliJ [Burkholderiales bacterium]
MSALQPLFLVLESAEKARDDARSEMEAARRAYEAARQQGQSLHDWRQEYQTRWQSQFRQSGGVEIVRCYQDFMQRLGEAVSEQERKVEQTRLYMERCRELLIERERKVAAVGQLIERRQKEAALVQHRQEQKATDEIASRAGRAKNQGLAPNSF